MQTIRHEILIQVNAIVRVGTHVIAIGNHIPVGIRVADSAPAHARLGLPRIEWTPIMAISGTIAIGIGVGYSTTANSGRNLLRIEWTRIVRRAHAIPIRIVFHIQRTRIHIATLPIAICVIIRIEGTWIAFIRQHIAIGIGFTFIRNRVCVAVATGPAWGNIQPIG